MDTFIDLLIVLEVLYGDRDRTAVGHKIAFRAATIVAAKQDERLGIFKLLKKAYDKRSGIVHGGASDREWVVKNLGTMEDITRRSLKWFTARILETGRAPEGPDIDKVCFEATPVQFQG
jgi:hypothetical protein